jgi:hypothetical protein
MRAIVVREYGTVPVLSDVTETTLPFWDGFAAGNVPTKIVVTPNQPIQRKQS